MGGMNVAEEFQPVRGKIVYAAKYFQLLGTGDRTIEWREPLPAEWEPEDIEASFAEMESSPELGTSQVFNSYVNECDADGMGITTGLYFGSQVIAPGQRTPRHRHTTETVYFIWQGEGVTDLDSHDERRKTRIVWKPGKVFVCPPGWWHAHENTGKIPMRISAVQNIPDLARRGLLMFDEGSGYQPVGRPAPQVDSRAEEPAAT